MSISNFPSDANKSLLKEFTFVVVFPFASTTSILGAGINDKVTGVADSDFVVKSSVVTIITIIEISTANAPKILNLSINFFITIPPHLCIYN